MARKLKHKKLWWILGSVGVVLLIVIVVLRLYLSVWLLDYVNGVLANIPGYKGSCESINIDLYRGAYRINKLVLNREVGKIPTPFVAIETTDFSVQWKALLHGRVVSKANLIHPVINFAVKGDASQDGGHVDWTKPIKDLMPIDINYVKFTDGRVTYQDFASTPKVDIYLHKMNGIVSNLRNVEEPNRPLPSTVDIEGDSIGGGHMKITGRMNILKPSPDMDIQLALENVHLPALNNYSEAYASFDFESGQFNLYSQLTSKDGHLTGYLKPMATDLSVDVLKKPNPIDVAWSAIVAGILKLFTNLPKDQFATRVDIDGSFNNVNTDAWGTFVGILRNAFVSAMTKGFDQTGNEKLLKPEQ